MYNSIWDISPKRTYPAPERDIKTDAVVIGGGISGITTAYFLSKSGLRTALIERGQIAGRTSSGTTAHLSNIIDYGYYETASKYGEDKAKLVARSMNEAIDIVESIVEHLNIDADFRRIPAYYYSEEADGIKDVDDEYKAVKDAGLESSIVYNIPASINIKKGFRIENNATLHPKKYLYAIAEYLTGKGVQIFENTNASLPKGSGPYEISAGNFKITTDYVIMATHTPIGINPLQTELPPYKSYVFAIESSADIDDALYYDNADPYHYIRKLKSDSKIIIIGGADHKTAAKSESEAFLQLEKYIAERFRIEKVVNKWSAQYYNPTGGLPFIGRDILSKNRFVATGYNGDGMIFGTLSGKMIASMIEGEKSPYEELYKPGRFPYQGAKEYVKENLEVSFRFIRDRFISGNRETINKLTVDSGTVINYEGRKVAVYKDKSGELTALSAACAHMGCIIRWNPEEKTWDCNCHGGRYSPKGEIIEGAPNASLKKVKFE